MRTLGLMRIVNWIIFLFLLVNLVVRFGTIFYYPPYNGIIALFLSIVVSACTGVILFPRFLPVFLSVFGFSFFLYGFGSIDIQSRLFELLVTLVAMTFFILNRRNLECYKGNQTLIILLCSYACLALFSMLLLPVRQILMDLRLFGFPSGFFYLFISPPHTIYYPVAAVFRLILFLVFIILMSSTVAPRKHYQWLFIGIVSGAVFSAVIGLLDFYGLISLETYRFCTPTYGALLSTFGNRGWFGEFILVSIPFILIGFMRKQRFRWLNIVLFTSLIICEVALILAGGRSGWVSYPLILFFCWLFFYFSSEGRLTSINFKWLDIVKVAFSVPITIGISFLLIFQLLMPLSDYLNEKR